MRRLIAIAAGLLICLLSFAQKYSFSGTILNRKDKSPVDFATVLFVECEQWATADANGRFTIGNIPAGKNTLEISCLGYVTLRMPVTITKNVDVFTVMLDEDNLTLASAVVTAKENESSATTHRVMDRTALDHVQLVSASDISGLLPGGVTQNPSLTSTQRFNLRAGGVAESGNASFGTAVEVDGVRLSNNASLSGTSGVATNNIATSNIESVEVISGVPSVEYGDVGAGIVKLNTRKGVTPYMVTLTTNPNIKQASFSKGFGLGDTKRKASKGVLNVNAEYTKSYKDQRSPYTSYDRKQISASYSNTFMRGFFEGIPLRFTAGVSGNLGGMDSKADPDKLTGTYSKQRNNSLRGNIEASWLLSKPWITNLEFKGSLVYSDNLSKTKEQYSSAGGTVALHGKEEGYFMAVDYGSDQDAAAILIPRGYWYNTMCLDDKPFSYKLTLKGNLAKKIGHVSNRILLGAEWNADGNFGKGEYSEDISTAPTYRTYDYSELPFMNNLAVFLQDNVMIPTGKEGSVNLIAGLRSESTFIKGSEYGTTSSLSPRFNAKYTVLEGFRRRNKTVRNLAFRASWGMAVKQPSFAILYPEPDYSSIRVLNPPTASDGSAYYGYYIKPSQIEYNPGLTWQRNYQSEVGVDLDILGTKISVAGYWNRTAKSFRVSNAYDSFAYNYTDQSMLESCGIPVDNRTYLIGKSTGIVTVVDKTGALPSETITGITRESLIKRTYADNDGSPVNRYGIEWVIDFPRINPVNTDIRLDGNFYSYKSVDKDLLAYSPTSQQLVDGTPYKYVGWYTGGNKFANGSEIRTVNANVTFTTHIPKARMILSLKVEGTLMKYSRNLSEGIDGETRTVAIPDRSSFLPSGETDFMDNSSYTATYPLHYSSYWDPTPRPFYEDYVKAKTSNPQLFNDLSALVVKTSQIYTFRKNYISPYFSANFSVTKEIGELASISFYANNFFRNMGQVYSTMTKQHSSVSRYIPKFYYGLTIRLKF